VRPYALLHVPLSVLERPQGGILALARTGPASQRSDAHATGIRGAAARVACPSGRPRALSSHPLNNGAHAVLGGQPPGVHAWRDDEPRWELLEMAAMPPWMHRPLAMVPLSEVQQSCLPSREEYACVTLRPPDVIAEEEKEGTQKWLVLASDVLFVRLPTLLQDRPSHVVRV